MMRASEASFLSRLLAFAAALVAMAGLAVVVDPAPAQAHPGHADHDWPEPPRNVQLEPGDGKLTLTWDEPSDWNDHTPAGFQIGIATGTFFGSADPPATQSDLAWRPLASVGVAATSYTITGTILQGSRNEHTVTNGTKYHLRIRAYSVPVADPSDTSVSSWKIASETPSAPSHGITVSPTSLTVPVGSRACYLMRASTAPTAALTYTATSSDTTKATVAAFDMTQQLGSGAAENWKVGQAYCVKGISQDSVTITNAVESDDTGYDGITVPSVSVTVSAADTKPTVRFLHAEMRVVEGDTVGPDRYGPGSVHNHDLKTIKVKLDVAPATGSLQQITWYVPRSDCPRWSFCPEAPDVGPAVADYNGDFLASGLIARQVQIEPNSNDAEFEFHIRSDNEGEGDETVRIFLLATKFVEGRGILDSSAVCIGGCGTTDRAQRSALVRIIDDDRAELIADIRQWRNDPRYVGDKAHTDRWDRALLAFGETVADTSLTPMTVSEALGYADRGWRRWAAVADILRETEND